MYALACVSFAVFVLYTVTASIDHYLTMQGRLLPSLSESYYLLESHEDGMGYFFTGAMYICMASIVAYWVEVTPDAFRFIPFIGVVGIGFVAAAPHFKAKGDEHHIHVYAALISALLSLVWCFIMHRGWIVVLVALNVVTVALMTRSLKTSKTFWAEMVVFLSVYVSLLTL